MNWHWTLLIDEKVDHLQEFIGHTVKPIENSGVFVEKDMKEKIPLNSS